MSTTTQNHQPSKIHKVIAALMVSSVLLLVVTFVSRLSETKSVEAQNSNRAVIAAPLNLNRIFKVNVPSFFKELVTMTALEVEGESIFGSEVTFENEVVFDGQMTLRNDLFANGVNIDVGSGEITASNILYSLEAGSGISISEGQNPTISATDLGSSQNIFKKIKVGSDTIEADSNTDQFELAAGIGISLSRDGDKVTFTNASLPGFIKSGTYAVLADGITRVGVGTSTPGNTLEVNSGVAGESGFSFTQLTSSSTAGVGGGKVLSLDSGGRIILVADQTGGTPSAESVLPSATNGMTIYYNGTNWVASDNFFHDGGSIGISNAAPTSRLHVNTNLASKIGLIVQGYASQTANLQEWRDSFGTTLSYIDANGVFNGQANVSGTINPGLTTGSVLFQGPSGITQDNSNFYWDDTNNRLGIGTNAPATRFHVVGSNTGSIAQFVNSYDGINWGGVKYSFTNADGSNPFGLTIGAYNPSGNKLMRFQADGSPDNIEFYGGTDVFSFSNRFLAKGGLMGAYHSDLDLVLNQHTNGGADKGIKFKVNGGGSTVMSIMETGYVGIGTTNPSQTLTVDSSGAQVRLRRTGSTRYRADMQASSAGLQVNAFDDTGAVYLPIRLDGSEFDYKDDGGTTVLKISTAGNVGIGTTTPREKLDVASGNLRLDTTYAIKWDTTASRNEINFDAASGMNTFAQGNAVFTFDSDNNQTDRFFAINSNTTSNRLMTILESGNVGIGTTTPGSKLDIAGDLFAPSATFSANYAAGVPLTIKGGPSGTGSLTEWKDSSGTIKSAIDANGNLSVRGATPDSLIIINGTNSDVFNSSSIVRGMSVETRNSGSGSVWASTANATSSYVGTVASLKSYQTSLRTLNASTVVTNAYGVEVQSPIISAGAITNSYGLYIQDHSNATTLNYAIYTGTGLNRLGDQLSIIGSADRVQNIIRANATQTANLTEWQNSSGTVLAMVDPNGHFTGGNITGMGTIKAIGASGQLSVTKRSDSTSAFSLYSSSGDLSVYNHTLGNDSLTIDDLTSNVGIGTTSPISKLDVSKSSQLYSNSATYGLYVSDALSNKKLGFGYDTVVDAGYIQAVDYGNTFNKNLLLNPNAGNVGIGTTSPGSKLTVSNLRTSDSYLNTATFTTGAVNFGGGSRLTISAQGDTYIETNSGYTATGLRVGSSYNDTNIVNGMTDGTFGAINFYTNATNRLKISPAGNVGIGTTSPQGRLHVTGTADDQQLIVQANGTQTANLTEWQNSSGAVLSVVDESGFIGIGNSNPNASLQISNGNLRVDTSHKILFESSGTNNSLYRDTGSGSSVLTSPADLIFGSGSLAAEYMRIASSGRVGIGTSSPGASLHIAGPSLSAGYNQRLLITSGSHSIGAYQGIDFKDGNSSGVGYAGVAGGATGSGVFGLDLTGRDFMKFNTGGDVGSATERMRIDNVGNVGIGTTNPGTKLDVAGDTRLSNNSNLIWRNAADSANVNVLKLDSNNNLVLSAAAFATGQGALTLQGHNNTALQTDVGGLEIKHTGNNAAYYIAFSTANTERVRIDNSGNLGLGATSFGTNAAKVLAIAGSTAPTTSVTDGIQLFAVDVSGSHELQVMDEAGNTTTLSPHNFSLIGNKSEELAWSFYSERNSLAINADMTKALRIVEKLSGEKLIYLKDLASGQMLEDESDATKITELADNGSIGEIAKWNYTLWTFIVEVIFEKPVQFLAQVTFNGKAIFTADAWFGGRTTFADKDMAGFAEIPAGGQEVTITFIKPYAQKPVVTLTPEGQAASYSLQTVSATGFTIQLAQPANQVTKFNWMAVMVEQAQTTQGVAPSVPTAPTATQPSPEPVASTQPVPTNTSEPIPSPEPTPALESTPAPSPSPEVSPIPATSPAAGGESSSTSPDSSSSATLSP